MKISKIGNPFKSARKYWKILGPGLATGAADDDPSGIATYSQVGASKGLGLIWLSLFTFPLMGVVQEMCARIGIVTGSGLASNIKRHYSRKVLYVCAFLLVFANVLNIGADLGAMAEASKLVFPQANFTLLLIGFALFSLALQIFIPYRIYSKYLKYLTFVLLAYIISAFFVNINWGDVLYHTFVPHIDFSRSDILLICAALGTTISPYLFFWQTSQEVEEEILLGNKTEEMRRAHTTPEEIKDMRLDVWSGMFVSNLVMFFIIAICSATLFTNGINTINTAADAARALEPLAGSEAYLLFTFGIIGTGLLAIPILAGSTSYAFSESFGYKPGLNRKFKEASIFYAVIILAMFFGILLNFVGIDSIKMLIYSAIFNGIISPVILFFVVSISGNAEIMGQYKSKKVTNTFGWFTVGIMALVSVITMFYIFV